MDSAPLQWHQIGPRDEVLRRARFSVTHADYSIALFSHEGRLRAIGNRCNHKGGPLCEGRLRGEFVQCPWHGWEYSVITGKGPMGYDEEQVPTFAVEERNGVFFVATPPTMPAQLIDHKPSHLLDDHLKPVGSPPRMLGISTTGMDGENPRFSTSDALLDHALANAAKLGADTQLIRLRDLAFRHCEGNYSKAARACTWPCAITERDPSDQLGAVYEGLVHWADIVVIATPIRWGKASSLYFKMTERLNCVQNQVTIADNVLIKNKVVSFIITGGQDNVQEVAGGMLTFCRSSDLFFRSFRSSHTVAAGMPRIWRTTCDRLKRALHSSQRPRISLAAR